MTAIATTVERIANAGSWNQRVQEIRRIPEEHGQAEHGKVYAAVAERLYKSKLSARFAFVPQRDDYELAHFEAIYQRVHQATGGFTRVSPADLVNVLQQDPESLLVFRTIIGYTPGELSAATREIAGRRGAKGLSDARLKGIEGGSRVPAAAAQILAATLDALITRTLWGEAPDGLRSKMAKSDTAHGWRSVRAFARDGVPYATFLQQRHMGGAFRQLLDAASEARGDMLEAAVVHVFREAGVPFLRTGSRDQGEIVHRFNLTVKPAPDFVVFDSRNSLRALIECKLANDGGTARDKASRFATLRREGHRLGGIPVFAVLDGLGWERVNDALGPVVRDCDGRVFTLSTLQEMLEVQPFPELVGSVAPGDEIPR